MCRKFGEEEGRWTLKISELSPTYYYVGLQHFFLFVKYEEICKGLNKSVGNMKKYEEIIV